MENLENLAKDPRVESSQVRSPTSIQFSFKSVLDSCRDTCYNFSIEGGGGGGGAAAIFPPASLLQPRSFCPCTASRTASLENVITQSPREAEEGGEIHRRIQIPGDLGELGVLVTHGPRSARCLSPVPRHS